MKRQERAAAVLELLKAEYPSVKCTLNYQTPIEMLIATQLSAQCTDARVNIVTQKLFKKYRSVEDFANADYDELCEDIRSAGFYRSKAKNIILASQRIIDAYGGEVPDTMEDLLSLAGTGRKTANLVLGDIFKKPAIVVDTHCIRLSNRIGLTKNSDPVKIEMDLKKIIPPEESLDFCHRLVAHGRAVCPARKPKCEECVIKSVCAKKGVK
ncbi:MAG: endonuclease III [Clostridia bacterium]|nr:endonuclease III [Clostridia bacterium]